MCLLFNAEDSSKTKYTILPGDSYIQVKELRRQERMDLPVPAHVEEALDTAQADLSLLRFKFAVLTIARAKRSATTASNDGGVDIGTKGAAKTKRSATTASNVAKGAGDVSNDTLTEDELAALLNQHVRCLQYMICDHVCSVLNGFNMKSLSEGTFL